jgi:hypothetical protein
MPLFHHIHIPQKLTQKSEEKKNMFNKITGNNILTSTSQQIKLIASSNYPSHQNPPYPDAQQQDPPPTKWSITTHDS